MNEPTRTRARDLRKYERIAISALLAVGVLAAAAFTAVAYGLYRVADATVAAVESTLAKTDVASAAGLDRYVLDVMDGWMASALREGDTAHLSAGLECLAALGGPSPERALEALAARAGDSATGKEARRAVEALRNDAKADAGGAPRAGACIGLFTS